MIPPNFYTIREWMMRRGMDPYGQNAGLLDLLVRRVGVPADVLIAVDRIVRALP